MPKWCTAIEQPRRASPRWRFSVQMSSGLSGNMQQLGRGSRLISVTVNGSRNAFKGSGIKRANHTVVRVASPAKQYTDTYQDARDASLLSAPAPVDNFNAVEPPHSEKPGVIDDEVFPQHWSVNLWRNFRIPQDIRDERLSTSERVQAVFRVLQEGARKAGVFDSPQSLAYWTYHTSRMGFFAMNGILGAAYSQYRNSQAKEGLIRGDLNDSTNFMDIGRLLKNGVYVPISESLVMFYQDYQNIRNGVYKAPWDMTTRGHRQTNPRYIIGNMTRWFTEAADSLGRREKNKPDNVWLNSNMYPNYYLNTWHYQTDGWLSDKSASVYETSTETVFTGRQDAMQRQSLVPISEFMRENGSRNGAGFELLDLATGTGRYATFVKDNYPKMGITQLDLSPFYLQKARENLDYWRERRGGSRPEDSVASKDKFLHAPAEDVPVPDESYDIVLSTYLFHEIPEESRVRVAQEMYRTCKPGGMVIMNDGLQYGDRPLNDATASNFQAFNEPNWGTHVRTNYGKLFSDLGLIPHKKVLASGSKVLSWKKMPRN